MSTKKKFDCVKMTREIRDNLYEEHKKMNKSELIEHYNAIKQETLSLKENKAPYGTDNKKE